MIRKAPARAAISFILAPLLVLAMLIGWVVMTEGWADALDPEGLAYVIAFTGFALPGLFMALITIWIVQSRSGDWGMWGHLILAGLTGVVVTCLVFAMFFELIVGWSVMPDKRLLVLPASIGIIGCITFIGLGGSRMIAE